jgi:hypothetical protein
MARLYPAVDVVIDFTNAGVFLGLDLWQKVGCQPLRGAAAPVRCVERMHPNSPPFVLRGRFMSPLLETGREGYPSIAGMPE